MRGRARAPENKKAPAARLDWAYIRDDEPRFMLCMAGPFACMRGAIDYLPRICGWRIARHFPFRIRQLRRIQYACTPLPKSVSYLP
jgi:hypothetical protein